MTFLFSVLSLKQNKKTLQKLTHNANYIASNIDLLIILFEDELQNLQGKDREYANSLFYAWSLQVLSESIQNKSKLINDKITYLSQAQMARSQKSMDAMITFLGGLALVDLTLVLSAYSNSDAGDDEFYGIVDLVKSSEPDVRMS